MQNIMKTLQYTGVINVKMSLMLDSDTKQVAKHYFMWYIYTDTYKPVFTYYIS